MPIMRKRIKMKAEDLKKTISKFNVKDLKQVFRTQKSLLRNYSNYGKLKKDELIKKLLHEHKKKTIDLEQIILSSVYSAGKYKEAEKLGKETKKLRKEINELLKTFKMPRITDKKFGEDASKARDLKSHIKYMKQYLNEGSGKIVNRNLRDLLDSVKKLKKLVDSKK
tara:strand:- start:563 stop:1063 length:501 start_codon:yes stop_codon:yes gene_type:complete